ncbi:MAG: hypothetical protein JKY56_14735, partial [Kofleriaceae bacterium]|nr:hypothetical protein [Kofleriaceae bacterium]
MMQSVFEAVLADPWSDEARSQFARAVEQTDPDRSALIEAQIRLAKARRRGAGGNTQDYQLVQNLLNRYEPKWRPRFGWGQPPLKFGRGFAEAIACSATQFEQHADELRAAMPLLDVTLSHATPSVLGGPSMRGLRSLDLRRNALTDEDIEALANSPYLASLRWLDLSGNQIGHRGLKVLAASTQLPALEWVGFARNEAPDPTPQIAEEHGVVHFIELPDLGKSLQEEHGPRAWLARPRLEVELPDPEAFHPMRVGIATAWPALLADSARRLDAYRSQCEEMADFADASGDDLALFMLGLDEAVAGIAALAGPGAVQAAGPAVVSAFETVARELGPSWYVMAPGETIDLLGLQHGLMACGSKPAARVDPVSTLTELSQSAPDKAGFEIRLTLIALAEGCENFADAFMPPHAFEYAPGAMFGPNSEGFVHFLRLATAEKASFEDVEPGWQSFLLLFPAKLAAGQLNWPDLLLA